MSIEFQYIGWCNETESDGTKHDKVWTAFYAEGNWYAGWGRRGKKLSFKQHGSQFTLNQVKLKKQREYNKVDAFQLFAIFPNFEEDVSKYLVFAKLAGTVK